MSSVKVKQEPRPMHLRFGETQIDRNDGEGDGGDGQREWEGEGEREKEEGEEVSGASLWISMNSLLFSFCCFLLALVYFSATIYK